MNDHLKLPFDIIACGVHVIQVHVYRWSRRQKYKLVKVIKLSISNRFGEGAVTLTDKETKGENDKVRKMHK